MSASASSSSSSSSSSLNNNNKKKKKDKKNKNPFVEHKFLTLVVQRHLLIYAEIVRQPYGEDKPRFTSYFNWIKETFKKRVSDRVELMVNAYMNFFDSNDKTKLKKFISGNEYRYPILRENREVKYKAFTATDNLEENFEKHREYATKQFFFNIRAIFDDNFQSIFDDSFEELILQDESEKGKKIKRYIKFFWWEYTIDSICITAEENTLFIIKNSAAFLNEEEWKIVLHSLAYIRSYIFYDPKLWEIYDEFFQYHGKKRTLYKNVVLSAEEISKIYLGNVKNVKNNIRAREMQFLKGIYKLYKHLPNLKNKNGMLNGQAKLKLRNKTGYNLSEVYLTEYESKIEEINSFLFNARLDPIGNNDIEELNNNDDNNNNEQEGEEVEIEEGDDGEEEEEDDGEEDDDDGDGEEEDDDGRDGEEEKADIPPPPRRVIPHSNVQDEILSKKSNGTFRWKKLEIDDSDLSDLDLPDQEQNSNASSAASVPKSQQIPKKSSATAMDTDKIPKPKSQEIPKKSSATAMDTDERPKPSPKKNVTFKKTNEVHVYDDSTPKVSTPDATLGDEESLESGSHFELIYQTSIVPLFHPLSGCKLEGQPSWKFRSFSVNDRDQIASKFDTFQTLEVTDKNVNEVIEFIKKKQKEQKDNIILKIWIVYVKFQDFRDMLVNTNNGLLVVKDMYIGIQNFERKIHLWDPLKLEYLGYVQSGKLYKPKGNNKYVDSGDF